MAGHRINPSGVLLLPPGWLINLELCRDPAERRCKQMTKKPAEPTRSRWTRRDESLVSKFRLRQSRQCSKELWEKDFCHTAYLRA